MAVSKRNYSTLAFVMTIVAAVAVPSQAFAMSWSGFFGAFKKNFVNPIASANPSPVPSLASNATPSLIPSLTPSSSTPSSAFVSAVADSSSASLAAPVVSISASSPAALPTYGSGPSAGSGGQAFTFDSLMALIQGNQVTSVDQLLPLLPQSYRTKFALMLQSGSLQSASAASPRVIAYGDTLPEEAIYPGQNNDRLYIAFQTDKTSQSKLPNSLEVIEWQPKTRDYKFYQLDFPLSGNTVAVNPDSCKDCHGDPLHKGNPLRPNWTAYSRWDGALGNNNGLTGSFDANFYPSQDEANKVVDGIQNGNDRLKSFDLSAFKVVGKIENPAANMSDKIGQQLQMRDIDVIRSSPDYDRFKYAFAGAFLGCVNYSDFFDARLQDSLQQGVYANLAYVPKTLDTTQEDLSYPKLWQMTGQLIEKNGTHFGGYSEEVAITTWLRFLLEGRSNAVLLKNLLGTPPFETVNVPQWTYDFVGFGDRIVGLSEMYLKYTPSDFPGFDNLYELGSQEKAYAYTKYNTESAMTADNGPAASTCQQLASKSRAVTAGYVVPVAASSAPQLVQTTSTPLDATGGTAPFQKYCTTCHGAGGDIVLPLDNLDKLKAYRTSAGRSISQRLLGKEMPPPVWPVQPSDDERAAMIGSLNN